MIAHLPPRVDHRAGEGFHPTMRLRAILFDYGGTLDGPASHWLDRFAGLYRQAGRAVAFDRLKDAFYRADDVAYADPRVAGMSLRELMELHVGVQLDALGASDAQLHRHLVDAFVADSETALSESRRVLERLAERYRLGVVSNFYGNVERILADAGFAPLLTVVADSNRVGAMKPDRRIFAHALAGLGTVPAETLHVGDSHERDVRAANALGMRTAWLVPAERRPSDPLPPADFVFSSLDELERHLTDEGERR
jgi:putative hydrolase of the HAD superfamily